MSYASRDRALQRKMEKVMASAKARFDAMTPDEQAEMQQRADAIRKKLRGA